MFVKLVIDSRLIHISSSISLFVLYHVFVFLLCVLIDVPQVGEG